MNEKPGSVISHLEWREERTLLNQKGKNSWKSMKKKSPLNYTRLTIRAF